MRKSRLNQKRAVDAGGIGVEKDWGQVIGRRREGVMDYVVGGT